MHQPNNPGRPERLDLRDQAYALFGKAMALGAIGMVALILLGYHSYTKEQNFARFFFAYLVNYMFFLTIALGALFFVLLQHLTKAAWSVNVRRIAEWLASSMPLMAALSAPIVLSVILRRGELYSWASTTATLDLKLNGFKQVYLSPAFFVGRIVFYFGIWSWLGVWYWKQSVIQDETGDPQITIRMQSFSAPAMVMFAITLTGAAYDLIMSLDPLYGSTMFGVFIFAGCCVSIMATLILIVLLLQSRGYLVNSVTIEHFHDLGKFLFGFIFFWGYIGFSQYMLQWYANIPEETSWLKLHGMTTKYGDATWWSAVIVMLLFGHLLIPFAGVMSRHVKRMPKLLGFWAAWMLVFHWIDMNWLITPEMGTRASLNHMWMLEIAAFMGIGGIFAAFVVRKAAHDSIRPVRDPRLADSLAFENV
jgi:hypothetical protein